MAGAEDAREPLDEGAGRRRLRGLGILAGFLVVALLAAGMAWFLVGGDQTDPKRRAPGTTQAGFCKALQGFQADFASIDPSTDLTEYVAELKAAARRLQALGVPDNMPADAKAGLSHFLGEILALPDDATAKDVARIGAHESPADQQTMKALDGYIASECPGLTNPG